MNRRDVRTRPGGTMSKRLIVIMVATALSMSVAPSSEANHKVGTGTGRFIVVLKDGADPGAVASEHGRRHEAHADFVYRRVLRGYAATIPVQRLDDVRRDPRVLYVAEDQEMTLAKKPGPQPPPAPQPAQFLTDAVDRIDGELSSTVSGNGSGSVGVNVAVFDSGVDLDHPDLNVVGGVNCSSGKGFDDNSLSGHGTFVAGLIGARDNGIGVVGVAPAARIWSVRVFGNQGTAGNNSTIICGLEFVTGSRTDADPTNDIAVANLSLGGPGRDDGNCGMTRPDPLHQAVCAATVAGVTVVAGAGNDGADLQDIVPAAYDEALTVTAMRDFDGQPGGLGFPEPPCQRQPGGIVLTDDARVGFSNFATLPEDQAHTVAAPGFCVDSTLPGGRYGVLSGTSFSGPQASGVVALCIHSGSCAGLTPAQIVAKITADAAAYNTANPGYGYTGDPQRPIPGLYYGHLLRAGLY